jgi:endonuclease YncB( thermonuclease family)
MKKVLLALAGLAFAASMSVAQDVVSFVHGTVTKVDKTTKTVVVKTKDGTEHTVKVVGDDTVKGTKDGFDGIKDGSEVVVRSTGKGADESAKAIGKVGKDGMKVTKGTVEKVDEGTKTVVVKSADGTEKTFEYGGDALKDSGKAVGKGTEKGAKVTVYYTEETGKKIAHFFEF